MIKIKQKKQTSGHYYSIEDLICENYDKHANAFIGKVGLKENLNSLESELYIITYCCIFLASDPIETFDELGFSVFVEKFVDLEIHIIDEE